MSKFFWLKLPRDFFKRHDMKILGAMQDGNALQNILIRLMTESIDQEGMLRFSDEIPYDMAMLAAVMDTDEETMKTAMKTYIKLGLVEQLENGTFFLPKVVELIGSETTWAGKKRSQRDNKGQDEDNSGTMSPQCPQNVPINEGHTRENVRQSKRLELEIEKESELDKEKEKEREAGRPARAPRSKFVKPTLEEVKAYCEERKNNVDAERFVSYYESIGWRIGGKSPMKDWKAAVRNWETRKDVSGTARIQKDEVPYMQKEYSKEYLEQKELDSLSELDRLLEE